MSLEVLALDGVVGHFISEVPEREVLVVLLGDLNDFVSVQNVCEVLLGSLVFVNKLLNSLNFNREVNFKSCVNVFNAQEVYVISGCAFHGDQL